MRNLLPLVLAAFVAACNAPAYQPPSVRVAPSYNATARSASTASRDSVVSASPTGLTQRAGSSGPITTPGAEPAQYSAEVSAAPFWRDLGDTTLAHLIEEALRTSVDVDAAEARVTGARATRRASAFSLGPDSPAAFAATVRQSRASVFPESGLRYGQRLAAN